MTAAFQHLEGLRSSLRIYSQLGPNAERFQLLLVVAHELSDLLQAAVEKGQTQEELLARLQEQNRLLCGLLNVAPGPGLVVDSRPKEESWQ